MSEPTKTPRKITLEELLRLKRHERPGPEFWLRFDRELNQRVWRSLVLPSQPDGILGGIFGRRLRWMAVGMISSAAFVFAIWPGATAPRLAAVAPGPAAVASQIVAPRQDSLLGEPVRVAMVVPVLPPAATAESDAQPQFAVAALESSSGPANFNKVPATVAFDAEGAHGVHYAADTLNRTTNYPGSFGSAY